MKFPTRRKEILNIIQLSLNKETSSCTCVILKHGTNNSIRHTWLCFIFSYHCVCKLNPISWKIRLLVCKECKNNLILYVYDVVSIKYTKGHCGNGKFLLGIIFCEVIMSNYKWIFASDVIRYFYTQSINHILMRCYLILSY